MFVTAALAGALNGSAQAQMAPTAKQFVMKAGASDKFEISEAKLMSGSANPDIKTFARQMLTDHTKSTAMVKTAAKADGVAVSPPLLNAKQKSDLAKLTAARGKARDSLYLEQQKAAHADALSLMQSYAASGKATHLKDAAGQIQPVVQSHVDMLGKMSI
jgi:putative membrane protein